MPDLHVRDLTMEFSSGGYKVRPIDSFDLDVVTGDLVLLLGASGCGKTTLLSMFARLLTPTSGTITFGDIDVTGLWVARCFLDCGRLPSGVGNHRAGLRTPRRLSRPAQHAARRAFGLRARLARLRVRAIDAAAGRGARAAGPGWRWSHDTLAGNHRRAGPAARARAVPGVFRAGFHDREYRRAGAWGNRSVALQLALAVLRQSAACGVRCVAAVPTSRRGAPPPRYRGVRCAGARSLRHRFSIRAVLAHVRRPPFQLGLPGQRRRLQPRRGFARDALLA